MYIYIYIERERERDIARSRQLLGGHAQGLKRGVCFISFLYMISCM